MILVHRQELLLQSSDALTSLNVEHSLIAPGHTPTMDSVQIASVQTLVRRLERTPAPDLIIIDEGHHVTAGSWRKIINYYDKAKILGVTATPLRLDGKGLGKPPGYYDVMVQGPTVKELIEQGYLSQPIVYAPPSDIDLTGIRTKYGDYEKNELTNRIDKPKITGDVVEHYLKLCPGVPAIVFAASVKHAMHIADCFNAAGIPAMCIDGKMDSNIRKSAIAALGNGGLLVLVSCDIVSEGTDIPVVTAAILLRPTQSLGLYLQQCGRCLRPFPGKTHSIILDHVGNCFRHGMPDDDRDWVLDTDMMKSRAGKRTDTVNYVQCEYCYVIYSMYLDVCPECGKARNQDGRKIQEVAGELKKITDTEKQVVKFQRIQERGAADTLEKLIELGANVNIQNERFTQYYHFNIKAVGHFTWL